MSELTLAISAVPNAPSNRVFPRFSSSTIEILALGIILSLLQVADGVMTGIGVLHFGVKAEGNILLRTMMESYGVLGTLFSVKLLAIGIIIVLCQLASSVPWVRSALKAVISIYLFAAILPWSYILLIRLP